MPFGFSLNGNKSKSTTNSTGTFNNTTAPLVPDWAAQPVQQAADRIGGLFGLNPIENIAPVHALHQQAAASAASLGTPLAQPAPGMPANPADTNWLSPHMQANTPFASGGKAYDWVGRYLNPYLSEVVDASAADLDANAGQVRAQQALDLAGSGAFGGSGAALTQSMTEGELARARATTLSGLKSRAFDTALNAAAGDAERATQARIANANLALQDRAQKVGFGFQGQQQQLAAEANQRANIATQSGLGDTLRGVDQQLRQAPITSTEQIVALLNSLPIGLFTGKTEQGTESKNQTVKTKGVSATLEGSSGGKK